MTLKRTGAQVLLIALLTSSFNLTSRAGVAQKQAAQGMQFPMKYEEGTKAIEKGKEVKVTVNRERVICSVKDQEAFSIPTASVTEITYDIKARRRLAEAGALAFASLAAAAVLVFLKTKKHFVNILWEEDGSKKEVIFKVGKGEYLSFLTELQKATGKEWKNLPGEREILANEIEKEKKNKVAVQLDRQARAGTVDLKSGLYQVVLLERGNQKGELCFFAGKDVEPKKIVAGALVEITDQASQVGNAQVVYKEGGQVARISEIRLPTKTLRFQ